jgi:hypothetical protein
MQGGQIANPNYHNNYLSKNYTALRYLILILVLISSCNKGPQKLVEIYYNDFEKRDLNFISGGALIDYNNQGLTLGRYNNGRFSLQLKDLPTHDLVQVSFDLYIHDSWEGNDRGDDGPDIWQMKVDGAVFINTTFSNCKSGFCYPQSYPLNYLNNKNAAGSEAFRTDLIGVCKLIGKPGGTSLYKIVKTISHKTNTFNLECLDSLRTSTNDPVCDESWAVDNLSVKIITLN